MTFRCISLPKYLPMCSNSNCIKISVCHSSQSKEACKFLAGNQCGTTVPSVFQRSTSINLLHDFSKSRHTSNLLPSAQYDCTSFAPAPPLSRSSQQINNENKTIEDNTGLFQTHDAFKSSKTHYRDLSLTKSVRVMANISKQRKGSIPKKSTYNLDDQFGRVYQNTGSDHGLTCQSVGCGIGVIHQNSGQSSGLNPVGVGLHGLTPQNFGHRINHVFQNRLSNNGLTVRSIHTTPNRRDIYIIENEEEFEKKVMRSTLPVVINFHADWCEPCHALKPLLEGLAQKFQGKLHLAEIKVDDHVTLLHTFEVTAVPAVLGIVKGQVTEKFIGLISEAEVRAFINNMIGEK